MTRTVMIDLPSVSEVTGSEWKLNVSQFVALMNALAGLKGAQFLYRDDMEIDMSSYEEITMYYKLLTEKGIPYNLTNLQKAAHTTSTPVLTSPTFPVSLNDDITIQVDTLHKADNTLFLVSALRRGDSTSDLLTTRDHKDKEHPTLTYDAGSTLSDFVASTHPVLDQLKHGATGYNKAGKRVSPFSSYDPRNEQPAKDLLARAYNDYTGDETSPKYLFTWDYQHNTYVQFRRSAEGTYHGMDYSDKATVPPDIKKIYNH